LPRTSRRFLTTGGFVPRASRTASVNHNLSVSLFTVKSNVLTPLSRGLSSALFNVDRVRSQSLFSIAHPATILDYVRLCGAPGEHPTGTVTLCASQLGVWRGFYQSILTRPQSSRSDISFGYCIGVVLSSLQWPQERQ